MYFLLIDRHLDAISGRAGWVAVDQEAEGAHPKLNLVSAHFNKGTGPDAEFDRARLQFYLGLGLRIWCCFGSDQGYRARAGVLSLPNHNFAGPDRAGALDIDKISPEYVHHAIRSRSNRLELQGRRSSRLIDFWPTGR